MGDSVIGKHNAAAVCYWGKSVYQHIPKSVFALVAWHLANQISEDNGAAERFCEEVRTLVANGTLPTAQAKRVLATFAKRQ